MVEKEVVWFWFDVTLVWYGGMDDYYGTCTLS